MSKGFSKPAKAKFTRIKKYTFKYRSSDGYLNIVRIEAVSQERAVEEFESFIKDIELCLCVVANQQVLPRIDGGES